MKSHIIKEVEAKLPSAFLDHANWADAYQFSPLNDPLNAQEALDRMFGANPPFWIVALNGVRNRIVGLFGVKPGKITVDAAQSDAFPIVESTEEVVVLGFDEWHLDFRVVIQVEEQGTGQAVTLTTLVHRKTWFGRGYIFLVTPFHRLVVKRLLLNLSLKARKADLSLV